MQGSGIRDCLFPLERLPRPPGVSPVSLGTLPYPTFLAQPTLGEPKTLLYQQNPTNPTFFGRPHEPPPGGRIGPQVYAEKLDLSDFVDIAVFLALQVSVGAEMSDLAKYPGSPRGRKRSGGRLFVRKEGLGGMWARGVK